jgi:hypothetical protein
MSRLIITARYGAEFLADAQLIDDSGRVRAQGHATLASRKDADAVTEGDYTCTEVRKFPIGTGVQKEFGQKGVLFHPRRAGRFAPIMVHGGTFLSSKGAPRAVSGSIRLDETVMRELVACVESYHAHELGLLTLEVRILARPSRLAFWNQPQSSTQVYVDDGIDVFDVLYPELAPFRHPNSGLAWLMYFNHQEQEARAREEREQAHRDARYREEVTREAQAAQAAQDAQYLQSIQDAPSNRVVADDQYAPGVGGQSSGSGVSDTYEEPAPVRFEEPCVPPAKPLFEVGSLPGVDRYGRVVDAEDAPVSTPQQTYSTEDGASSGESSGNGSSDSYDAPTSGGGSEASTATETNTAY